MEYVGALCACEEWYVAIQCTEGQDRGHFAADVGADAAPARAGRFPIPHGTSNESAARGVRVNAVRRIAAGASFRTGALG